MKRTFLTFFLLSCSLAMLAQKYTQTTLQPRLFLHGKDTLFSFTQAQTREIAKRLTAGEYDQQTIVNQSKQIVLLSTEVANQKNIVVSLKEEISLFKERVVERDSLLMYEEQQHLKLKIDFKKQERALRRQRVLTRVTGVLGLVGIVIALIL